MVLRTRPRSCAVCERPAFQCVWWREGRMYARTLFFMTRLNPLGSNILTFVPGGKIAAVTSVGRMSKRAVSVCSIIVVVQGQAGGRCDVSQKSLKRQSCNLVDDVA